MIAKRYYNMLNPSTSGTDATLKLEDLVQEGHTGLLEAADRFDETKGCRFSTYATFWVKQRIIRSIAESSRMIRLPEHVQTTIRNMHKTQKELEIKNNRRPSMPELAHEMGIPLDKIHVYQHMTKKVLSLELPVDRHSNTDDKRTLGDCVASTEVASPDEDYISKALRYEINSMLESLGHEEREVLSHRFGLHDGVPHSVKDTAKGMGVSSDMVRNVEAQALHRLRQPQFNYRLKSYIQGPEVPDPYTEAQYHSGWAHAENKENNEDQHHQSQQDQQQQQHHYHYPTNGANSANIAGYDEGDDRATPESIWSF